MSTTLLSQPKRLSLKKNFSWMFLGESVDVLSRWGLLAVLSKLLNAEAVGLFGLSMAIVVPTIMFFNMGLRHAQATDVAHEYSFGHYQVLRRFTTGLALLLIAVIAWFVHMVQELGRWWQLTRFSKRISSRDM